MICYHGSDTIVDLPKILEAKRPLGCGWWVGFSFAWCATLYAMQYNGNASYEKLRAFVKGFFVFFEFFCQEMFLKGRIEGKKLEIGYVQR